MDPSLPMILPKGIVVNTKDVYKEVASYTVLPPDKIRSYWHVYTITNKKLKDPTACRLENFWWHVWGSDRRHLSGRALAKLYEDISVAPAFVPLKGPSNRWEGPDAPAALQQLVTSSRAHQAASTHQHTRESSPVSKPSDGPTKSQVSSASKPQPSHPILKKVRGPSASGPRPTARFVSPHESEEEDDKDSQIPSSGSTVATNLDVRKTLPSPAKKKQPGATRKFVANSSAAKRRPLLSRRPSSQSSTASKDSDTGSREAASSFGSRNSLSHRPVSPISENSRHTTKDSRRSHSAASLYGGELSSRAAGKRPEIHRRTTIDRPEVSQTGGSVSSVEQHLSPEKDNSHLRQAKSMVSLPGHGNTFSTSNLIANNAQAKVNGGVLEELISPKTMVRSQSHQGYERSTDYGQARGINQGLFTGATASTTNIAALGTIIDQSGLGSTPVTSGILSSSIDDMLPQHRQSLSSILDSRLTPTQPSASASVPLARTKSQLTLLLEREKAKKGDKPRSRN